MKIRAFIICLLKFTKFAFYFQSSVSPIHISADTAATDTVAAAAAAAAAHLILALPQASPTGCVSAVHWVQSARCDRIVALAKVGKF